MTATAISAMGVGKVYRLGRSARTKTLRESLTSTFTGLAGWFPPARKRDRRQDAFAGPATSGEDPFWALKDVSFQVAQGEVLGVMGRNGAGKSTLLKILSRITSPSTGSVELAGRVSSLLEVGTGFHPELTGRENIYLNGAILGMQRSEVRRHFSGIVDFAELDRFLDTPVKHYSSGMYMRLAFGIAAHLEPDILVVDEVLAVGDAEFQKKCLGRMGDVARAGRTVLFVSHNLAALSTLCPRAILLSHGRLLMDGPTPDVINQYIGMGADMSGERCWTNDAPGNDRVRLRAVRVVSRGQTSSNVSIDAPIDIELEYWNKKDGARLGASIHVLDQMGACVLASVNMPSANLGRDDWFNEPHPVGVFRSVCTLPPNFLNEGTYGIHAFVLTDVTRIELEARDAVSFTVHETGEMRKEYTGHWAGIVRPRLAWQSQMLSCEQQLAHAEVTQ